jgi:crotonobetainyl-CoA:carnitine CoA-transferase CaiB-like acyl-CoA transferase
MTNVAAASGPLAGIKVLDLSRILAGPWASQALGDLGAEIFKIEQPGQGDDSRKWGPPFLDDGSRDSAYYCSANRNKRSIAIDMAAPEGAALIRKMVLECDIVVENFRVGSLAKFGLDYPSLKALKPSLIYCSITGFGQTGPFKDQGGYDFLIQGMSGLMSVTGRADDQPGGGPMKVGIPVGDLVTGLYSTISILAALHHRDVTGEGQQVDCCLLDSLVALLVHQASNYLNGGVLPRRLANEHPNVVPYRDFACADGDVIVALGNDGQFRGLCRLLGREALGTDPRFADMAGRNVNRQALYDEIEPEIAKWKSAEFLAAMDAAKLPGGKVNEIPEMLQHPQLLHRELVQELARDDGTKVKFIGFPAKFSETPPNYRLPPPRFGEGTNAVLQNLLGMTQADIDALRERGVVADRF